MPKRNMDCRRKAKGSRIAPARSSNWPKRALPGLEFRLIVTILTSCCRCKTARTLAVVRCTAYDAFYEFNSTFCRLRALAFLSVEVSVLRLQQPRLSWRHR